MDLVYDIRGFLADPDESFRRKGNDETVMDSLGREWSWAYSAECNVPDRVVREWDFLECQSLLLTWFKGVRIEKKIQAEIEAAGTIKELFERVADFF
jgi:hypothetical protein